MGRSLVLWCIYIAAALSGLVAMWLFQGLAGLVLVVNAGEGDVTQTMLRYGPWLHLLGALFGVMVYAFAAAQFSKRIAFWPLFLGTALFVSASVVALISGLLSAFDAVEALAVAIVALGLGSRIILGLCARS